MKRGMEALHERLTPFFFPDAMAIVLTHRLWSITVHLLAIQPVVCHARSGELVCHFA